MTLTTEPAEHTADGLHTPEPWTSIQKTAFRFLFTLGGGLLFLSVFGSLQLAPVMQVVRAPFARIGAAVSGTELQLPALSNSGDSLGVWQYHFGWAVVAVAIAVAWSLLDGRRTEYRALGGLLWQVGRVALASGMIFYGMAKVIPTQMAFMHLPTYALQPAGDISRMNMLWGFMGASDGYSIVTGLVELLSGLLLLSRRTWILGALGSIVSMTQVLLMDTFYNVPVKFLCFEFLVIAIMLLAPQWRGLVRVAFGRAAAPMPQVWRAAGADRKRLRRTGKILATLAVLAITALGLFAGIASKSALAQTRGPIDGVWHATSFRVDGREAALADSPWINVAITYRGRGIWETFGKDYDSFVSQDPTARVTPWFLKADGTSLTIKQRKSGPESQLAYSQPDPDHLILVGRVNGSDISATFDRRPMKRASEHLRFTHPVPDDEKPTLDAP